jgi:ubiquinone/menaquinone biosynthesis C-methylase UbiE
MNTQGSKHFGDVDEDRAAHHEHLQKMVSYYEATASNYNKWHCDPSNDSSHNYAVREVLSVLKDTGSQSLLDVCCGTGRATKAALEHGYAAIGVDVSSQLLAIGRKELGIPENRLIQADATRLPFPDNSFDVACVFGALHHTAMPRLVVSEMIRVSKNAIVISDEANGLSGGVKSILVRLGLFEPIYRLIFRRSPRQHRRQLNSDGDGPTFVFSIEEIIPMLTPRFSRFKCLTFYRIGSLQICSYAFPRVFARHGVISVSNKTA